MRPEKTNDRSDAARMASAIATVEPVDAEITRKREWEEERRSLERRTPRADVDGW